MTVTSPRSQLADQARATLVAVLALAQVAVASLGAHGAVGLPTNDVSEKYRTPVLAAGWGFLALIVIDIAFLAYAGYQCFPRQRHRLLHRRTGWWAATAAAAHTLWSLAYSAQLLPLAELLAIIVLVSLATAYGRLSREAATSGAERMAFRLPIALYTGWMSVSIMMTTASTGVWLGLPGTSAIAVVASIIVLVGLGAVLSWVVFNGTAVLGYSVTVVWALAAIVLGGTALSVAVTAIVVIGVVVTSTVRRILASADRVRAAFG